MNIKIMLNPIGKILQDKGLDPSGAVQCFHTQNVLRRIEKYIPYLTGETINQTTIQTDISKPAIVTEQPFAKYLYYGMAMEGKEPKHATDRPLHYTKIKNPRTGPFWDRALVAAEGEKLVRELQRYINRRQQTQSGNNRG